MSWYDDIKQQIKRILDEETADEVKIEKLAKLVRDEAESSSWPRDSIDM